MKSEFRRELEAALDGTSDVEQVIDEIERALRPKRDGVDVSLVAQAAGQMKPVSVDRVWSERLNRAQRRASASLARKRKR